MNEFLFTLTFIVSSFLLAISESNDSNPCPPCPAKSPCYCSVHNYMTSLRTWLSAADDVRFLQMVFCPDGEELFLTAADQSGIHPSAKQCALLIANSTIRAIRTASSEGLKRDTVVISDCPNLETIEPNALVGSQISRLIITRNPNLASIQDHAFGGATGLAGDGTWLQVLSNQKLTSILPQAFQNASGISQLTLQNNGLMTLPKGLFQHLSGMKGKSSYLNISEPSLKRIQPGAFQGLSLLNTLSIYGTQIKRIPKGTLTGLTELSVLTISHNSKLHAINEPDYVFQNYTRLLAIDFSFNNLKKVPVSAAIANELLLQGNELTESALAALPAVWMRTELVNLANNNITSLAMLITTPKLWVKSPTGHVDLRGNPIRCDRESLCFYNSSALSLDVNASKNTGISEATAVENAFMDAVLDSLFLDCVVTSKDTLNTSVSAERMRIFKNDFAMICTGEGNSSVAMPSASSVIEASPSNTSAPIGGTSLTSAAIPIIISQHSHSFCVFWVLSVSVVTFSLF